MTLNKIALIALSNPIKNTEPLNKLLDTLKILNIQVVSSSYLLHNEDILNRDNLSMAEEFIDFLNDSTIDGVFDISGGDLSNAILPFINFNKITNTNANFFGYSDLTVILNALITHTQINVFNYQILNIIRNPNSLTLFKETFLNNKSTLYNFNYRVIENNSFSTSLVNTSISGIAIGGNIRCFLKLAGTSYMPDLENKILFLESYSGNEFKMLTYINQLLLLKNFSKIKAIVLGNFTEMDSKNISPSIEKMFLKLTDKPLYRTQDLGHNSDSKCIQIGKYVNLSL